PYWLYGCLCVSLLFALSFSNKWLKNIFVLLILICMPYKYLFETSRMGMLSNLISIIFVISILSIIFLSNKKKWVKVDVTSILILLVFLGFYKMVDKPIFLSIFNIVQMKQMISRYDNKLNEGLKNFTFRDLKVGLYNENLDYQLFYYKLVQKERKALEVRVAMKDSMADVDSVIVDSDKAKGDQSEKKSANEERVDYKMANIVFRLFIWTDILDDIKAEKKIFGIHFGKPFRSKRLEILDWGTMDWQRDGWIAAHNSYLNLIYRGGIVGVILILYIFVILFRLIKYFIAERLISGILLCSVIIYWLVSANFLVILELPQYAIPFWSLYGFTFAYYLDKKKTILI
ncbi:MAG: O-antigen ligase family protein, partial [Candidatus Omnitrophica bacterium]|nr:O-antigen ligase family protein [Candidatus Omnitrophota bacterium]MBU1997697.1 O-antigen ligase family protein [Candidatus Omnitrophota bacterium]